MAGQDCIPSVVSPIYLPAKGRLTRVTLLAATAVFTPFVAAAGSAIYFSVSPVSLAAAAETLATVFFSPMAPGEASTPTPASFVLPSNATSLYVLAYDIVQFRFATVATGSESVSISVWRAKDSPYT